MSCDYDVYCRTCRDHHGFNDANHASELMQVIAKAAPQLATIILPDKIHIVTEIERYGHVRLEWFRQHANHDIVVIDEYGQCLDECGEWVLCNACGSRSTRCTRPLRHEGTCAFQGVKEER